MKDFKEETYSVVIEYHHNKFGTPTINEICKRESTPEGTITRKARISVLGQLHWEREYLKGEPHGTWYSWHPNGNVYYMQNYANGRPHGIELMFSPAGEVLSESHFRDGKMIASWEYTSESHYEHSVLKVAPRKWTQTIKNGTGGRAIYDIDGRDVGYENFSEGE